MIFIQSPIQYLFEVSCCLLVFYLFYHWVLRKETFFQFNRFYLLITPLVSLIIPCFQTGQIEIVQQQLPQSFDFIPEAIQQFQQTEIVFHEKINTTSVGIGITWSDLFLSVYIFVVAFFLIKLLVNLLAVQKMIMTNPKEKMDNHFRVTIGNISTPFSFFNYLFWNGKNEKQTELMLQHEQVHIQQKHSIDVIFMELLVAFFWFHPLIYRFRKAIKMTHEFLADQEVTQELKNRKEYASLLLSTVMQPIAPLSSTFNSFIKNRLVMIFKEKTSMKKSWRLLAIIPLSFVLITLFSFDQINSIPNDPVGNLVKEVEEKSQDILNQEVVKPKTNEQIKEEFLRKGSIAFSDLNHNRKRENSYVLYFEDKSFVKLHPQNSDKNTRPPTVIMTYETAKKIALNEIILVNPNQGESLPFTMDIEISKKKLFDDSSQTIISANLNKQIKNLEEEGNTFFHIKNIKSSKFEETLNMSIIFIPESSFSFNWGKYEFLPSQEIKMPRNEFIHHMTNNVLKSKNSYVYNGSIYFTTLMKKNLAGREYSIPTKENHIPRTYSDQNKEYQEVMNTKVGERYFFKNICLESPSLPCGYSFSVLITEDNPSANLPKAVLTEPFSTQYLIDGKSSSKSELDKMNEDEILSIDVYNKYGEPSTTEKEDRLIIIKTKKKDKEKKEK